VNNITLSCSGINASVPRLLILILFIVIAQASKAQRNAKYALPLISAHRGAPQATPENTLAAFAKAIEMNADFIEIDVRTTADGTQVIMHDGSLKRTTGLDAKVSDVTLAEIRKLSAGKGAGAQFEKEKVPTLEEVCLFVSSRNKKRDRPVNLYVDCKSIDVKAVINTLAKYHLLSGAVFYGDTDVLREIKEIYGYACLMPSCSSVQELDELVKYIKPYAVDVPYDKLDETLISACHARDIKVFSDLLDEYDNPSAYRRATQLAIDLIQTDNVNAVLQVFSEFR
jgi:glycerophosphoryl diester phosphodiesterase